MLLKKVVGRSRFYDILHRTWVNTCVLATLGGVAALGISGYVNYTTGKSKSNEDTINSEHISDVASTISQKKGELL